MCVDIDVDRFYGSVQGFTELPAQSRAHEASFGEQLFVVRGQNGGDMWSAMWVMFGISQNAETLRNSYIQMENMMINHDKPW